MLSELDYVLKCFPEHFSEFIGKRIIIHGTREYADAIIDQFQGIFKFIGVMTRDSYENKEFHGLPILDESSLGKLKPDLIILTERVKYAEAVYQDICKKCECCGISLYNMYGVDEINEHRKYEEYQPLNIYGWQKLCGQYAIVMFETVGGLYHEPDKKGKLELRTFFYRLIMWMQDQGIDVKFMLRKSFPEELQIEALEKEHFFPDLASHIVHRSGDDLSFRKVAEHNPEKKILYICESGIVYEWLLPRCYGIDTYRSGMCIEEQYFDCFAPLGNHNESLVSSEIISRNQLLDRIKNNDIISFDIFDTLLLRKTLCPEDLFDLVEHRALKKGISAESFSEYRKKAITAVPYAGINEIYQWIEENSQISKESLQMIQDLELETENDVIVPRKEIADLLNIAVNMGKEIILTSDMYWPASVLSQILREKGIKGWNKIFVSCDYGKGKQNGLFGEIIRIYGNDKKILHIGDNKVADGLSCTPYGIESIIIPSTFALAMVRGWKDSIDRAQNWFDRCLLGMTIASLFSDPFQAVTNANQPVDVRLKRFSNSVIGPIAVGFLSYLINKLKHHNYDMVLFVARDCWLFYKIYGHIRDEYSLPRAHYLYSNRHSSFLTCSDVPELAHFAADSAKFDHLTNYETLKRIYEIGDSDITEEINDEPLETSISRNISSIRYRAEKARSGYLKYFDKNKIQQEKINAFVDFIAKGTTQKFLEKGLGYRFYGIYFANYDPKSRDYTIEDYLITQKSLILKNYIELESFVTSPEPAVKYIREDGEVVFDDEIRNSEEIYAVNQVLCEAEKFAIDYFDLFYQEGSLISPDLIDEIFAAEGYHWVQLRPFNSWTNKPIATRGWINKSADDN